MNSIVDALRRLLPAAWSGALLAIALVATPAAFATLPRADAGRVVAHLFATEAWLAVALALVLWLPERARARQAAEAGAGSVLSTEMVLLLGALFCTLAGYFGVQQLLPAARTGRGALSFAQLHGVSVAFYGVKTVLVAWLAWRGAARPGASAAVAG